jgi:hypothetical protein
MADYSMGGENPNIIEGITEYLTHSVSREVAQVRRDKGKRWRVLGTRLLFHGRAFPS